MVRAITFDAFGTVIDTGRDVLIHIARQVAADHGSGLDTEAFLDTWDRFFFGADMEEFLNLAEVTEDSLAKAFAEHGIEADTRPYIEMLETEWLRAKAYPEVSGVLEALDGVPRAIVSNADDEFLKRILARNGLQFDAVITSEFARCYKPRPRIFELALEALRVRPEDVLHIGDSLDADVAGAQRLGMRTVWVNRIDMPRGPGDPRPEFELPDLRGLPDVLTQIYNP